MAAELMKHYFNSEVANVEVATPCNLGTVKGNRLDCWLRVDSVIYQVEIKNWSSHSFGGKPFPKNDDDAEISIHLIGRWKNQWDEKNRVPKDNAAKKVLIQMNPKDEWKKLEHRAMLCFWDPMNPEGKIEPLFNVPTSNQNFQTLYVFSLSNYVRQLINLGVTDLQLDMPITTARINWLKTMCPDVDHPTV